MSSNSTKMPSLEIKGRNNGVEWRVIANGVPSAGYTALIHIRGEGQTWNQDLGKQVCSDLHELAYQLWHKLQSDNALTTKERQ